MAADNRFQQFNKTKMCKFDAIGRCKKGRECPFAHTITELKPVPNLRCTKLCKALVLQGTCTDPTCGYAHSKEELRSTGAYHKTKLCRFMQTGHCALGKKCNFAHNISELRDMDLEAGTLENEVLLLAGGVNELTDVSLEGMMLPPGLEDIYDGVAKTIEASQDCADVRDLAKMSALSSDSPAYIRLSPTKEGKPGSVGICQAVEGSATDPYINLDAFKGDIRSLSTRSETLTPPSSDCPNSPRSSSKSTSEKEQDQAMGANWYHEAYLAHHGDPGAYAYGFWNTDPLMGTMPETNHILSTTPSGNSYGQAPGSDLHLSTIPSCHSYAQTSKAKMILSTNPSSEECSNFAGASHPVAPWSWEDHSYGFHPMAGY